MKNKKGFTLVEVLVVIVIIALLGGIGVVGYQTFFKTGEERYFDSVESNVLLAANDYFTDHRDQLPTGNEVIEIGLNDLVVDKYVEPIKDSQGNVCDLTNAKIYAYRENNKYVYEMCLKCGNYASKGKYCENDERNIIHMTAITKSTKKNYVLTSYNSAEYTSDENVLVTLSMENNNVKKYEATNTKTNTKKSCNATNKSCTLDISESGTYKVAAYDGEGNVLATNQYFNVKISRNGPKYTLNIEKKYQITKAECSSNKTTKRVKVTIVKDNINEEYDFIEYTLNGKKYSNIHTLTLDLGDLASDHYVLEVAVYNFAGEVTRTPVEFDVTYLINMTYDDEEREGSARDPNAPREHEVVKGYNYNYLSSLPEKKKAYGQNLTIRWHLNDQEFDPKTKEVTNSCTHTIVGKMSIPVNVEDFTKYCTNPVYNTKDQDLTKTPPAHVTFSRKDVSGIKGKDAGTYHMKAVIDQPQYIWQNGTTFDFTDKYFDCSITKADNSVTITPVTETYTGSGFATTVTVTDGTPTVTYYSDNTCKTKTTTSNATAAGGTPKTVGTYYAIATVDESNNYKKGDSGCKKAVVIDPAPPTCPTTTEWSGKFDNQSHSIDVSGGAHGEIQYSKDNKTWSTTKPSIKNVKDSPLLTYVRIVGSGNYAKTVTCTERNVKISKADCTMSVTDSQSWSTSYSPSSAQTKTITAATNAKGTVTYTIKSQKKGSTTVSKFSLSSTTLTVAKGTDAGTYTVVITAKDAGSDNYNGCSKDITVTVTIQPIKPTITCANKEYNTKSQVIATCTNGTIANESRTDVGTQKVTCTGTGNYAATAERSDCKITPAKPTITCANKEYNTKSQEIATCTNGKISNASRTDVGTQKVTCTGTGNYAATAERSDCKINPKVVHPSCSNKTWNGQDQTGCDSCEAGKLSGHVASTVGKHTATCTASGNYATGTTDWYINPAVANTFIKPNSNVAGQKRFTGANPSNCVKFNNQIWRVLGIYDSSYLKIIYATVDDNLHVKWHNDTTASWDTSIIKAFLNGTYYNKLNAKAKSMIQTYNKWPIGASNEYESIKTIYSDNIGTNGSATVGTLAAYEYFYAGASPCENKTGKQYTTSNAYGGDCSVDNWIKKTMVPQAGSSDRAIDIWTINKRKSHSTSIEVIYPDGYLETLSGYPPGDVHVYPAVYLKSTVVITGGAGTCGANGSPWILDIQ